MSNDTALRRSLSLPLVTLYGLGNILGAGIYVLIGKVAGESGYYAPIAFLLAAAIAAITAFSFAELSSRFPLSAGEAIYVQNGFGIKELSAVVGLLIILTGIVSAGAIARGFVGYLDVFIMVRDDLVIICLLSSLAILAVWGISESVAAAALLTLIEVGGVILILIVTAPELEQLPQRYTEFIPRAEIGIWAGLFSGAFLAFYAYVGFEDMVNIAEEVKQPSRNMPIAILSALSLATLLYILLAFSSLLTLTPEQLNQSDAPLAEIYTAATGRNPWIISIVSLFAVINGALVQIIMASRVCYGLAKQNWLPRSLAKVNPVTKTPVNATILVTLAIILAALFFPIETLARITTYLLLIVFSIVNLALIRIKRRGEPPGDGFQIPIAVPILGFSTCLLFLLMQTASVIAKL